MSITFTRSMRSLRTDTFRYSLAGMIAGGVVLIVWGVWFFLAPIPQRETTSEFHFARDGSVLAQFSAESEARIAPGQLARLIVHGAEGAPDQIFPALVMDTPNASQYGAAKGSVKLSLLSYIQPAGDAVGEVEVVVGTISPAALVLRLGDTLTQAGR